jgi:hypothetical protein
MGRKQSRFGGNRLLPDIAQTRSRKRRSSHQPKVRCGERRHRIQMNTFYWFILGAFGVWRITHLLNAEDGPGEIFVRLRRLAGSGILGGVLDCFYCLSVWIAAPFAWLLASSWRERLFLWPALSGAAILIERFHRPVPQYFEGPAPTKDEQEEIQ